MSDRKFAKEMEDLDVKVSEAVMYAERHGLTIGEIVETVIGSMSIRPGYDKFIKQQSLVIELENTCPGCGFIVDHDEGECPQLRQQEIRTAVALVLGDNNEHWEQDDTDNIIVEANGRWVSPGTFGSDYGTARRALTMGMNDSDGMYVVVTITDDDGKPTTLFVKI